MKLKIILNICSEMLVSNGLLIIAHSTFTTWSLRSRRRTTTRWKRRAASCPLRSGRMRATAGRRITASPLRRTATSTMQKPLTQRPPPPPPPAPQRSSSPLKRAVKLVSPAPLKEPLERRERHQWLWPVLLLEEVGS